MTDKLSSTPFGEFIRAARLGYRPFVNGWLRISDNSKGFRIQLQPSGLVPQRKGRANSNHYLVWWECGNERDLCEWSPILRAIKRIHKETIFVLDTDSGAIIEQYGKK